MKRNPPEADRLTFYEAVKQYVSIDKIRVRS
jgi:hypothetical protein